jgi:hypothetical protein
MVIKPRLDNKNYGSRIYFRDIHLSAKDDLKQLKLDLNNESETQFKQDLEGQIIALSSVCSEKYAILNNAGRYLAISFLTGLLLVVLLSF